MGSPRLHAHLSTPHTQTEPSVMTNHAPLHVRFNRGGYPSISKYYSAANSIAHVPYIDQLTVINVSQWVDISTLTIMELL